MFNPQDPDSYLVFHMLGREKDPPISNPSQDPYHQIGDYQELVYGVARIDPDLLRLVFTVAGVEPTAEQQEKIGSLVRTALAKQASRMMGRQTGDDERNGQVCQDLVCGRARIDSDLLQSVFKTAGVAVTAEQQESIGCLMQGAMVDQAARIRGERAKKAGILQILIRNASKTP